MSQIIHEKFTLVAFSLVFTLVLCFVEVLFLICYFFFNFLLRFFAFAQLLSVELENDFTLLLIKCLQFRAVYSFVKDKFILVLRADLSDLSLPL